MLAGGLGTRLQGREKALLPLKGSTFIENTLQVLETVCEEVIISFRDEAQRKHFGSYARGRNTVLDTMQNTGPLAGMLEGFRAARGEYVFVTACDMPYISPDIIELMFRMAEGHDAVVPVSASGTREPLHAVYRRVPMLRAIEASLQGGNRFAMSPVLELDDVLYPGAEVFCHAGKGLMSFANINTPEDLEKLEGN